MQLKRLPCRGWVLLEALFALALLDLGMWAALTMTQMGLYTQRQQLARETAMGLAQDLSQRMQLNATQLSAYAQRWGQGASVASNDCQQSPCTAAQLAQWDVQMWRARLAHDLPSGDATVFASDPGWWGIVLAWRDERETLRTDTTHGTPPCPAQSSCWRLWVHP